MSDVSSISAVLFLRIPGLFDIPQQIQGFAAEDLFEFDAVSTVEAGVGADGKFFSGKIRVPRVMKITLLASSDSNKFFDAWDAAETAANKTFTAQGTARIPSISTSYAMTDGAMTTYSPMAAAKKILMPRQFTITWGSVVGAPL